MAHSDLAISVPIQKNNCSGQKVHCCSLSPVIRKYGGTNRDLWQLEPMQYHGVLLVWLCHIGDYSVRPNQGIVFAKSINSNPYLLHEKVARFPECDLDRYFIFERELCVD